MKTLSKKIINLFLALTMVLSVSIPALAMETQDNVTILQDDNNVRVARAYIDGELAVSTFYKQSGILTIESNGSSYTIQTKDTKNFGSTQKNNAPREKCIDCLHVVHYKNPNLYIPWDIKFTIIRLQKNIHGI